MCGIVGILDNKPVNQTLYDGLTVVQHRGQDAAGIMTSDGARVYLRKDNGLVQNIFHTRHMIQLAGHMGIGHNRYPTAGCDSRAEAQPFYVNSPFGISLGHNGNLTNTEELREVLYKQDLRQLNTSSDSEVLLNVFAHELKEAVGESTLQVTPASVFKAVEGVYKRCKGAFAVIAMIVGGGILAFRDPFGIRPLAYGTKRSIDEQSNEEYTSHFFASESSALDVLGYELDSDVKPGEAIFIDIHGNVHRQICAENPRLTPCIFEYVYLARPDSVIDDVSVYQSRIYMGEKLGQQIKEQWPDNDIDVIIPIPDTSRTAALEMARILKRPFREGFVKNRYIGRTFIMPGQEKRKKSVRQKLNTIEHEFQGKNVLLVDDSIVRGTTSKQIINFAREAGANKVYFASAAPPVRFANVYGIDMPSRHELVAHQRSIDEIAEEIGADRLFYQKLEDLEEAVKQCNPAIEEFDSSCFSGEYITGDITPEYLQANDSLRNDDAKQNERNELDISEISQIPGRQI